MRHVLIVAHPGKDSLTAAIATAYRSAAEARGDAVLVRDLYAMGFDPCLKLTEIPGTPGFVPSPDVAEERKRLVGTDVFALFYPLWLNAPPAILKGYLERVFGFGFAYDRGVGGNEPLLTGKKFVSFTTSGAPTEWVKKSGAWDAVRTLFDEHFAAMCGFTIAGHHHLGGVVPRMRADVVERHLAAVRTVAAEI
ncbi:MAG: flavodoxin family protein [Alphaproteobacteria bacterium]|nr:flavodoxin family protein [Alphaproteobacteria bacterium]